MPAFHGLAAPVSLLELGKLRPEIFHGSPLSQMNLSLTTGGDGNILHTEPLMNIRVAIKKGMRKGGREDVGEKEERMEEGRSGILAMPIIPALGRETE